MDGQAFLRETARLIGAGWCRDADARDSEGAAVGASDPSATAWSLLGALVAVSERLDGDTRALRDALWGITGVMPEASLDGWNNAHGRTQHAILRMLVDAETSLAVHPPPETGWSVPV